MSDPTIRKPKDWDLPGTDVPPTIVNLPAVKQRRQSPDVEAPSPAYICRICGDAGYMRADVPVGHPDFGKIQPCIGERGQGCPVYQRNSFNAIKHLTVVPEDLSALEANWATFPPAMDKAAIKKMQLYTARVISRDLKDLRGALLYGKNQIGKTGLAYCVHQDVLDAGLPSVFIDCITLFQRLQVAMFDQEDKGRYMWLLDRLAGVYHLVLDDLGAEKMTETREEGLFLLLNRRTKAHVVTTITSNLDGAALETAIGTRSYSRIIGHTFRQIGVKGDVCAITKTTKAE